MSKISWHVEDVHMISVLVLLNNSLFLSSMAAFQAFVRKVMELHDKYLQYVNEFFMNHSLFHKVG